MVAASGHCLLFLILSFYVSDYTKTQYLHIFRWSSWFQAKFNAILKPTFQASESYSSIEVENGNM